MEAFARGLRIVEGRKVGRSTSSRSRSWSSAQAPGRGACSSRAGNRPPRRRDARDVAYFELEGETPSVVAEVVTRGHGFYSLHDPAHGLKVGSHKRGTPADPDVVAGPDPALVAEIAEWTGERFPRAKPEPMGAESCFYTATDDERFIIERHGRIVVGSACSGHAFKFAPASRQAARRARGRSALTKLRAMPMYQRLGDVPRKRHIQFRDNGTLLNEEVMGLEGFSGNESILYHLQSPVRIRELGDFEPIERDEWVPDAHAHRHFRTYGIEEEGDPISGRQAPDVERRRRDLARAARTRRWTSSTATARATR